ncbi:endonuclease/exonuclease/phosphatase family protein [Sphingomonas sp.]|uniref:endonuclease/exonuclease/phosphatase family protein n=1 Tax=Sphingomonas sp. TaxID=28214 RepID=UPI003FA699A9
MPGPAIDRSGDRAHTTLSVLTYNIEGLSWPARTGRAPYLAAIAERLAAMRAEGTAPDVVLFQEMFSPAAKRAVAASGYPAIVSGARRTTRARGTTRDGLPGRANALHGEIGIRVFGSGLAIASRYPIVHDDQRPFGRRSCAGIDCLANKGVQLARIAIPGVPGVVSLYNTHMNSRGASRAPAPRHLAAHDRQALEASRFIDDTLDDGSPLVFGGDFNMRHSEARWENFTRYKDIALVHRVCADPAAGCEVRMSWDGDEPWMDTQDLQFFEPGGVIDIRPIRVEAMFDGGSSGQRLSDHDGFLVTYRLSWPVATPVGSVCTAQ